MKLKALARAYQILNKSLFDGDLPAARLEIDATIKSIFYYRDPALVLGSAFADASVIEILDCLLHDMIHVWNKSQDIEDYTPNQYHNKHFCDAALARGLYVCHHAARGWSITSSSPQRQSKIRMPSPEAALDLQIAFAAVKKAVPATLFSEIREMVRAEIDEKPRKQFQLKYICECWPPVIVRSGRRPHSPRPLNVTCNDCGAKFVIEATK